MQGKDSAKLPPRQPRVLHQLTSYAVKRRRERELTSRKSVHRAARAHVYRASRRRRPRRLLVYIVIPRGSHTHRHTQRDRQLAYVYIRLGV